MAAKRLASKNADFGLARFVTRLSEKAFLRICPDRYRSVANKLRLRVTAQQSRVTYRMDMRQYPAETPAFLWLR